MPEEEKFVQAGSDEAAARKWGRRSTGGRPGKLTTPVPPVSRVEPGPQLLMFGSLHRRAQQALLQMLLPGEQPLVVVPGAFGCGIIGTDSRALVGKAGARFGAPFGARAKAFEYESVIGVRLDTETSPAVVAIDAPHKIASCRVYWADTRDDPWKARNAIPVDAAAFGTTLEQVVALRGLIEAYRRGHPALTARPALAPEGGGAGGPGGVVALPVLGERCPSCRSELRPGWHFCPTCGRAAEPPGGTS
jgi:hypothetical protein